MEAFRAKKFPFGGSFTVQHTYLSQAEGMSPIYKHNAQGPSCL